MFLIPGLVAGAIDVDEERRGSRSVADIACSPGIASLYSDAVYSFRYTQIPTVYSVHTPYSDFHYATVYTILRWCCYHMVIGRHVDFHAHLSSGTLG